MQSPQHCPKCGGLIPAGTLKGQCPSCLLAMARGNLEEAANPGPTAGKTSRQFGDYLLGRQLGGGGMGIVYEAVQQSLHRKVAIKLIRDWQLASPTLLRRFTIEAEAAARLDHPHIVPIFEIGEVEGQPFISMGLIEGESLAQKIARGEFGLKHQPDSIGSSRWRDRQTVLAKLMLKMAQAVEHAHQRGVIHRDLKPANILLDAAGEPHLTDFGLAKLLALEDEGQAPSVTNPEDLLGTPNYMSPEQATRGGATQASDIYGLGAVMFALLTGRPPFAGKTVLETVQQVAVARPTPPRSLNPLVHLDLDTICMKCLEKNPLRRYPSAEALALDLKLWLENRPIVSRPVGPLIRTGQWAKRNPVGTALILSLCLGLTVSLGMLLRIHSLNKRLTDFIDEMSAAGMQKIEQIYSTNKTATLSAKELAALFGRPLSDTAPKHEFTLGVRVGIEPSSTAHKNAERLSLLEAELERELREPVAFSLKLFQAGSSADEMLAKGKTDLTLMNAVEFAQVRARHPGIVALAHKKNTQCLVFVRADSKVKSLGDLHGQSIAFPNPDWYMNLQAKARLVEAGVYRSNLLTFTNFVDQGPETGRVVDSRQETMLRVFKGEYVAGVTSRKDYESTPYFQPPKSSLVSIAPYEAPGELYVVRMGGNKLDQRLFQALQKAAVRALEMKAVDEAYFKDLRETIRKARQFDGEEATNGNGILSASRP